MKILGTGLTGLVGSRVTELLKGKYEFENLSRSTGFNVEDKNSVFEKIKNSDASVVLHLAAKTDVDGCEKDKELGENGGAWKINVLGTKNIADACLQSNKKLIYISTDFVFDGINPPAGGYTEEDVPNPVNWYAKTKFEGEKIVRALSFPWIIVRIAYPYRANFERNDFFRAILGRLTKKEPIKAVTDHVFCPTFIDDIASVLDNLLQTNSSGIFHAVGRESLTPYDAAIKIAKIFNCDESLISKTTREVFFKDRAKRPFQLALKNDRIEKLGIKMRTFEEGLREVKSQNAKVKITTQN